MTRCEDVRELLSEAALGDLPSGGAAEIEGHLRRCDSCAASASTLRETLALVRSARPLAPADPGLAAATLEACRAGPPAARTSSILAVLLLAGMATLSAVLLSKTSDRGTTPAKPASEIPSTKAEPASTKGPPRAREPGVEAKALPLLAPLPEDELARIERARALVLALNTPRPSGAELATRERETWPVDPGSYSTSYGGTLDGLSGSSVERAIAWLPASH